MEPDKNGHTVCPPLPVPILSNLVESFINTVQITEDIESPRKSLKDVTYGTFIELLGLSVRKYKDWFDDSNTKKMLDMHKNWIHDKNSTAKNYAREDWSKLLSGEWKNSL